MSSGYAFTIAAFGSTKNSKGTFSNSSKVLWSVGSLTSQTTIMRSTVLKKISSCCSTERSVKMLPSKKSMKTNSSPRTY